MRNPYRKRRRYGPRMMRTKEKRMCYAPDEIRPITRCDRFAIVAMAWLRSNRR